MTPDKPIESLELFAAKQALKCARTQPEHSLLKLLEWADRLDRTGRYRRPIAAAARELTRPGSVWLQLARRVLALDEGVQEAWLENGVLNAWLLGGPHRDAVRAREGCAVPWALGLDGGLPRPAMDSLIRQGKELGIFVYLFTGTPARKEDWTGLCRAHPDCLFAARMTGPARELCAVLLQLKNLTPVLRLEPGAGCRPSMELLRAHRLPFAVCVPRDRQTDERCWNALLDAGALLVCLRADPARADRVRAFRQKRPLLVLDLPRDAPRAGVRYIAPDGVRPCPFLPGNGVPCGGLLQALKKS